MRHVLVSAMLACVALFVAGCGGGSSPTAPSTPTGPTYPSVAGNYSGTMTFTFSTLGGSVTCPVSTTVSQTGASVTIGTITASGTCASFGTLPSLGTFTITSSGSLGTTTVNNVPGGSCNGSYSTTFTSGFSGSTLQFTFAFSGATGDCATSPGNFTLTGTLTKQ